MPRQRRNPPDNVHPLHPKRPRLDTATLEDAVAQLMRTGARVGQLRTADGVTPIVDLLAPRTDDDTARGGRRAVAASEIIREAIASVGGTYGTIMEILLQLAPGTINLPLTERRAQSAALLEVSATTFRIKDQYEKTIMRIFTMEVYRIVIERGITE